MCRQTGDFVDSLIGSGRGNPTDFSVTVASRDSASIKDAHYEVVATCVRTRACGAVATLSLLPSL